MFGWCTAAGGRNHDNISTYNATAKHTSSDLMLGMQSIQQELQQYCCSSYLYIYHWNSFPIQQELQQYCCSSYLYISLELVPPFRRATPPEYRVNPIPKRNLALLSGTRYFCIDKTGDGSRPSPVNSLCFFLRPLFVIGIRNIASLSIVGVIPSQT